MDDTPVTVSDLPSVWRGKAESDHDRELDMRHHLPTSWVVEKQRRPKTEPSGKGWAPFWVFFGRHFYNWSSSIRLHCSYCRFASIADEGASFCDVDSLHIQTYLILTRSSCSKGLPVLMPAPASRALLTTLTSLLASGYPEDAFFGKRLSPIFRSRSGVA